MRQYYIAHFVNPRTEEGFRTIREDSFDKVETHFDNWVDRLKAQKDPISIQLNLWMVDDFKGDAAILKRYSQGEFAKDAIEEAAG